MARRGAGFQSPLGGELVDQAIGQRIAEGHAQLKNINTDFIECQRQIARGGKIGIARADIDNEPLLSLAVSAVQIVLRCDSSREPGQVVNAAAAGV